MRVLAIDGGGIRGLIPAAVLAEIERRAGRRIHELFDLIAGTSTGGILACALTVPQPRSAQELVGLYVDEGPHIFHRSLLKTITSVDGWIDERYDDSGLNKALEKYLGHARLKDAITPIFITAYDIEHRAAYFFRSARAKADPARDFALWEVARCTSAAPTYFEPYTVGDRTMVDGGVFAINPAMCAFVDGLPEQRVDYLVSLGTGSHTEPIKPSDARGWGQIQWARPVIDVVFDGVADTTEFELGRVLPKDAYVRLQTNLTKASGALDDASAGNLKALEAEARDLIAARSADIDAIVARVSAA